MYLIRDTAGDTALAFTYRGALKQLAHAAADAAVFTIFGRWIAGRRLGA